MYFCNDCGHVFTEAETDVVQLIGESELLDVCPKCSSLDIEEIDPIDENRANNS